MKAETFIKRRHDRRRKTKARSRGVKIHQCRICLANVPDTFSQDHHETPRAAGGQSGPIAKLCSGCHHNTHRVADMLMSNRAPLAEDSAKIMYTDPGARDRLFALATIVVEFMTLKRDGNIDLNIPVRITVELMPHEKLAAQMIANDHRGPTGRRLGLSTWVASLVRRVVYEKYPHLRKEPK